MSEVKRYVYTDPDGYSGLLYDPDSNIAGPQLNGEYVSAADHDLAISAFRQRLQAMAERVERSEREVAELRDAHHQQIEAMRGTRDGVRRELQSVTAERDQLRAAITNAQHGVARYLADPLRTKTWAHAEVFIELLGERLTAALSKGNEGSGA